MESALNPREQLAPKTACVRLTGGSSSHSTWFLEDGPGGTAITLGSDPSCDWKIKAANVPAHAVSVLLLQGAVYVRGADEGRVLLNGQPLPEGWQPVQSGARIDIGLARLEVTLGAAEEALGAAWPRSWSVHNVERPSAEADASPSILVDENVWLESEPPRGRDLDDAEVSGLRPSRQFMPERPSATTPEPPSTARTSWFSRLSRPSLLQDAPSLIGKPQAEAGASWVPYLGAALMAVAYVLWVTLLDR